MSEMTLSLSFELLTSLLSSLIYLKILMSLTDTLSFFFSLGAINFIRRFSVVSSSKFVLVTWSSFVPVKVSIQVFVGILIRGLRPLLWPFLSFIFSKSLLSSCFLKSVLTDKAKFLFALFVNFYLFASVFVRVRLQQELASEPFDELCPKSLGACSLLKSSNYSRPFASISARSWSSISSTCFSTSCRTPTFNYPLLVHTSCILLNTLPGPLYILDILSGYARGPGDNNFKISFLVLENSEWPHPSASGCECSCWLPFMCILRT